MTLTYVVRTGDTLYTIARRFNTTVERLVALNNISDPNMIMVGMVLRISEEEPAPRPPLEAEWCPRLSRGSRGNAVRELQRLLANRGYNVGNIDGIFGNRTRNAVMGFQRAQNLNVTGVVDIETWRALGRDCRRPDAEYCPILRPGSRGSGIRFLQSLLARANYYPGPIDGIYGSATERAVRAFQRDNNITPTGIVDESTWAALGVSCVPQFPDGEGDVIPGQPGEEAELNYVWEERDGFRYILATNEQRYYPGQRVRIIFRKRNITDETVTLRYSTSQLFDFYISDEDGNEIWRWSEDRSFLPVEREMVLAPGEDETTEIIWNQRDKFGRPIRPQTFTLWGTNLGAGESIPLQFVVSETNF